MSEQEAFEKFWGDRYKNTVMHDQAKTAWNAAISYMQEQSEPVGELILDPVFLPALKAPLVNWKINLVDLEVGTKFYTSPQPIEKCESETSSQPVAYMNDSGFAYAEFKEDLDEYYGKLIPLYTSPQPKEWVGLSDEQLLRYSSSPFTTYHCVKDAEAKLKQLNTKG